jgi:hypothetical protein
MLKIDEIKLVSPPIVSSPIPVQPKIVDTIDFSNAALLQFSNDVRIPLPTPNDFKFFPSNLL